MPSTFKMTGCAMSDRRQGLAYVVSRCIRTRSMLLLHLQLLDKMAMLWTVLLDGLDTCRHPSRNPASALLSANRTRMSPDRQRAGLYVVTTVACGGTSCFDSCQFDLYRPPRSDSILPSLYPWCSLPQIVCPNTALIYSSPSRSSMIASFGTASHCVRSSGVSYRRSKIAYPDLKALRLWNYGYPYRNDCSGNVLVREARYRVWMWSFITTVPTPR
ncbi:hypothetical protein LXA43DRAFT_217225 [Ganoderma leucocontextum]|nr:hypothetical protein LXA43DRAFT_217225 [Ganoderma leucocontextum]